MSKEKNNAIGLYIHIPFCEKKCLYCDFVSYEHSKDQVISRYFDALSRELKLYGDRLSDVTVKSIFFGGGTPSSVDSRYIRKFLADVRACVEVEPDAEITLEANPGTLTQQKITDYVASGINRVSLGLQTADAKLLKVIGRQHNLNDFITSYEALRAEGIRNINVDVMFGLPGQTLTQLEQTLKLIESINPEHISAYALKLEEGTPLYEAYKRGKLKLPVEDVERAMYHRIQQRLLEIGMKQYEISNFAKEGYASRHNLVYWQNTPYIGLGVAAHSKFEHTRYHNSSDINSYCQDIESGRLQHLDPEFIDLSEDLYETIILGLRLNEGLNYSVLNQRYDIDFLSKYAASLEKLNQEKLIILDEVTKTISLTALGMDVSNRVFVEFLEDLDFEEV